MLALVVLAFGSPPAVAVAADAVQELQRAEVVHVDAEKPPGDEAAWRPVTLPDDWSDSGREKWVSAWYRVTFDLPDRPGRLQAVFCSRLRNVAAIHVNGRLIGQTGNFGQTERAFRPFLYSFAPELLEPGRNVVHVRLWRSDPSWRGAIAPLSVGDWQALQRTFNRERFLATDVPQLVFLMALLVGTFALLIWWQRPGEAMFGYFGVSVLALAVQVSISQRWWPPLGSVNFEWEAEAVFRTVKYYCLVMYTLRFAQWHRPRLERTFGWTMGTALVLMVALDLFHVGQPLRAAQNLCSYLTWAAPGLAALLVMLVVVRRAPSVESIPLLLGHLISVAGSIFASYRSEQPEYGGVEFTHIHMVPLLLVMGWIVTRRFAGSLKAAETLNVELAQRVEAKRVELEANYRRLGALEKEQAVTAERARLMSDMHDGIGGQLISTLSLVEHGEASKDEIAAALRECVDDLRLAIDSLEPTEEELLPVLGNLRYRLEPRLKAHGIALDWQVADVPKLACLTPQNVLHVLRILQEAFTNVLKHAQAKVVRVATSISEGGVSIDICDDGRGFDAGAGGPGHGLSSMRQRARAVGGDLSLHTSSSGTTLSLRLPRLASSAT